MYYFVFKKKKFFSQNKSELNQTGTITLIYYTGAVTKHGFENAT